jgi:hypothetical protein
MDIQDESVKEGVSKFTKSQITSSKKYKNRRDLVNAILDDSKLYSIDEVDALIKQFMKNEVN